MNNNLLSKSTVSHLFLAVCLLLTTLNLAHAKNFSRCTVSDSMSGFGTNYSGYDPKEISARSSAFIKCHYGSNTCYFRGCEVVSISTYHQCVVSASMFGTSYWGFDLDEVHARSSAFNKCHQSNSDCFFRGCELIN